MSNLRRKVFATVRIEVSDSELDDLAERRYMGDYVEALNETNRALQGLRVVGLPKVEVVVCAEE